VTALRWATLFAVCSLVLSACLVHQGGTVKDLRKQLQRRALPCNPYTTPTPMEKQHGYRTDPRAALSKYV
jgi:hypothetical protein